MTVSMPRRRPGRVFVRLVGIVVAAAAMLALPSLAAPSLAAAAAPTPTGHWTFDEGAGTTAADTSGQNNPLTLQNGASWGPGVVGPHSLAVSTPRQQYAQSAGPVIDTTQSFTVSAWVYLTSTSGYQTFVSQDGTQISGFFLQLRADTGRFAFTRPAYDSPKALGIIASAPNIIPQPNEWYHLAGVYDEADQTISLYVNGVLQQTVSYVPNWGATGSLAVGRGFFNSGKVDFVSGNIDDVRTYAGALSANAISQLAGPGQLGVDASQRGPAINPTQFGEFLEEINHSGDGGLYAELIRNRDLKESASSPVGWSEVGASGTDANV
ncbi:MAG: LamG domain-containing protein, partial [Solirubrobacteraceae bacterium]